MSDQMDFIRIKNFIDGEWVEETGVEYVSLYNPSTGEQIGEVPLSTPETSAAAVESSYSAYDSWRRLASVLFLICAKPCRIGPRNLRWLLP